MSYKHLDTERLALKYTASIFERSHRVLMALFVLFNLFLFTNQSK